ncbi:hypothetical protein [Thalassospira mesophila]|uniref:Uncharacterized protein n=1 Tax=Thalassospira mesophila TaxID=1293891 RepID=A0A1Y2L1A0_9PROT|nr:hypothetical protein [Thalassospira mesophila]OSQ39008.1 hypothetical protein TMES_09950 [Thalassospira mesophila]
MGKRGAMDVWAALCWAIHDQRVDLAIAANDDWIDDVGLSPRHSVTGVMMDQAMLGGRVDGGGPRGGPDVDLDAEIIWLVALGMLRDERAGIVIDGLFEGVPVKMQRYLRKARPVSDMIVAGRMADLPDWMPGGWQGGMSRREVEESRLKYIGVWDALAVLSMRLKTSTRLGKVIEKPSFPRLPWHGRKKAVDS